MWRATPSILDVRITGPGGHAPAWSRGPNPSGGFQSDACFDTLQNQALSASHPSGSVPLLLGPLGTPTNVARHHDILTTCPRPMYTATPPRFSFTPCTPSQMKNLRTYQITNSRAPPGGPGDLRALRHSQPARHCQHGAC